MRYTIDEESTITGEFTTGNTVTISLYKLSDNSSVSITSNACTEITTTGVFKWSSSNLITRPTEFTEYLWIMDNGVTIQFGQLTLGGYPEDISYIEKHIYINTTAAINGNGKSSSPFNVVADAVDFAESVGWYKLIFLADATLERTLKNFTIEGIGLPTIDFNGQNVDKSEFLKVKLTGQQVGAITAREVIVLPGASNLSGVYKESGFVAGGTYDVAEGAIVSIVSASALLAGTSPAPPIFDLGASTSVGILSVRKYSGGISLKNINTSNKLATIQFSGGQIILDSTCTSGIIKIAGIPDTAITNNSNGSSVIVDSVFPSATSIWGYER